MNLKIICLKKHITIFKIRRHLNKFFQNKTNERIKLKLKLKLKLITKDDEILLIREKVSIQSINKIEINNYINQTLSLYKQELSQRIEPENLYKLIIEYENKKGLL